MAAMLMIWVGIPLFWERSRAGAAILAAMAYRRVDIVTVLSPPTPREADMMRACSLQLDICRGMARERDIILFISRPFDRIQILWAAIWHLAYALLFPAVMASRPLTVVFTLHRTVYYCQNTWMLTSLNSPAEITKFWEAMHADALILIYDTARVQMPKILSPANAFQHELIRLPFDEMWTVIDAYINTMHAEIHIEAPQELMIESHFKQSACQDIWILLSSKWYKSIIELKWQAKFSLLGHCPIHFRKLHTFAIIGDIIKLPDVDSSPYFIDLISFSAQENFKLE